VKIRWSPTAILDIEEIRDYIAADDPKTAQKISAKILTSVAGLSSFPLLGRPGRVAGTRELVIPGTPFIAAYRVDESEVVISKVLRGRRSWPKSF
jgi:addiction module RelE/StbE family toxin